MLAAPPRVRLLFSLPDDAEWLGDTRTLLTKQTTGGLLIAGGEHPLQQLHRIGTIGLPDQHVHTAHHHQGRRHRPDVIGLNQCLDPFALQSGLDEIGLGDRVVGAEPDQIHGSEDTGIRCDTPSVPDITSPGNENIKWLVRLRESRHRDAEGLFVVEGDRLYRRALEAGLVPEITFVTDPNVVDTVGKVLTVDPAALDRASYRRESEGVLAVFPQLDTSIAQLDLATPPLILIAENVEKPGNLGAMLRTAGAAGADALITVGESLDAHNPNVVRASTGALFTVPLAMSDWDELAPWLEHNGIRVICATPDAAEPVWEAHLTGPLALVVGAEDAGLSPRALALADRTVLIPQDTGIVDSLNVSVAAAILLFEARRQRTQEG